MAKTKKREADLTTEQIDKVVDAILKLPQTKRWQQVFERSRKKSKETMEAIEKDAERRFKNIRDRHWKRLMQACEKKNQELVLAEPFAQNGTSVREFFAVLPSKSDPESILAEWRRLVDPTAAPSGITDSRGWEPDKINTRLDDVMKRLDWDNTTGSARKWWDAFRNENDHRPELVLRLAEELLNREGTITEFFLAYVYSNTDNILANLHYFDYSRLNTQIKKVERESHKDQKTKSPSKQKDNPELAIEYGFRNYFNKFEKLDRKECDRRLEAIKQHHLNWTKTTGGAAKYWKRFVEDSRPQMVLCLAEELKSRNATITEFFLAYENSNTDNIRANLHYFDYARLKKEEERKKKEATEKAKKKDENKPERTSNMRINKQERSSVYKQKPIRSSTYATKLKFVICPSCGSIVPAVSKRCRMCGVSLQEQGVSHRDQPMQRKQSQLTLSKLGLSTRITKLLAKNGISTLNQLSRKSDDQLLEMRGVGPATAKRIRVALNVGDTN